jgi:hypothetical protein
MSSEVAERFEQNLEKEWLKHELQADLKLTALHRDVLKLLRCYIKASSGLQEWNLVEIEVIKKYKEWIQKLISSYPTTLDQDESLLAYVEANPSQFYWMYQFVLVYRIGQKEILREQLYLAAMLIKALETYGGDREVFN